MAEFPPEAPWGEVNMDDLKTRVARALSIPQHHTGWRHLGETDKDLFYMQADYALTELDAELHPPQHDFWGPGEAACPREIKAGNGELHTMRCKRCGLDNPRDDSCRATITSSAR